jgi:hypothetical protein
MQLNLEKRTSLCFDRGEDVLFDNTSDISSNAKRVHADKWEHSNTEELMKEYGEKAAGLRWMHRYSAVYWRKLDSRFTMVGICISAIVSTSSLIGATENFIPTRFILFGVGFIGMLQILNQSLARFYNSVEKATLHDTAAKEFGTLNRLIAIKMSLARIDRGNPQNFLKYILKQNEKLFNEHSDPHPSSIRDFRLSFKQTDFAMPDIAGHTFKINVYEERSKSFRPLETPENDTARDSFSISIPHI